VMLKILWLEDAKYPEMSQELAAHIINSYHKDKGIVQFHGFLRDGPLFCFVTHKCDNDLFRYCKKRGFNKKWDPEEYCKICCDMLGGISFMHRHGIAHRDLKMENILKDSDGTFKICDFGNIKTENELAIVKDYVAMHGNKSDWPQSTDEERRAFFLRHIMKYENTCTCIAPDHVYWYETKSVDIYTFGIILVDMFNHSVPRHERDEVMVKKYKNVDEDNYIKNYYKERLYYYNADNNYVKNDHCDSYYGKLETRVMKTYDDKFGKFIMRIIKKCLMFHPDDRGDVDGYSKNSMNFARNERNTLKLKQKNLMQEENIVGGSLVYYFYYYFGYFLVFIAGLR